MRVVNGFGATLNGFDLVGTDPSGATWKVRDIENWLPLPATTGTVTQNAYADGGWLGEAFFQPKPLRLIQQITASGRAQMNAAISQFNAAIPVRSVAPLAMLDAGVLRYRMVRMEGAPALPKHTGLFAMADVQLVDPFGRMLSGDGSTAFTYTASTGLPSTTGGLTVPFTLAATIPATVTSGSVTVTNQGNTTPPVKIIIAGPVTNPVIRTTTGGLMTFTIALSAGQTLEVDLDKKTVKINGTVNRRNTLAGSWIVPAAGTVLSFDASSYNSSAQMTVQWSDAWR